MFNFLPKAKHRMGSVFSLKQLYKHKTRTVLQTPFLSWMTCCCCRTRGFYWNPSGKVNIWNKAKSLTLNKSLVVEEKTVICQHMASKLLWVGCWTGTPAFGFNLSSLNPSYLIRGLPAGSSLKCCWLLEAVFVCQIDLRKTNLGSKSQKHQNMLLENSPQENTVSSAPPTESCQPKVPALAVNLLPSHFICPDLACTAL